MPEIVLATLNAKFIHAAFGLRYLYANMGALQPRASVAEYDINQRPLDIVESLLSLGPKIIGFGVYIWNVVPTTQVVEALKRVRPDILIVLGGPEVSYETEGQRVVELADVVLTGEADHSFGLLCQQLLAGQLPATKVVISPLPAVEQLQLPYDAYTGDDLRHRVVYVEASRGCPFTCEFCLSSLDIPVRQFPLEAFLEAMQRLMDRGLQQFKFVDRTFNLNLQVTRAILLFFLERHVTGRFYHFEMIPDRLPEGLRDIIKRFPSGSVQFEVGIQTFNPEVSKRISRRLNDEAITANFRFLREETGVHIHADLIVGLPGEDLASFARGFDRLVALGPQEIQVGILKRLRGTPIGRHDVEWGMVYAEGAPYEILQTSVLPFEQLQRLRRFSRFWDLIGDSGNFRESLPLAWAEGQSPFNQFLQASDWIYGRLKRTHQIALVQLYELWFEFLTLVLGVDPHKVAGSVMRDFLRSGRKGTLEFLASYLDSTVSNRDSHAPAGGSGSAFKRQRRHL